MGTLPHLSIVKGPTRPLLPSAPIHLLFQKAAIAAPNKIALIMADDKTGTKQITYGQLEELTNNMARTLQGLGIRQENGDGDYIIAVNMHPSEQLIIVLLAIWKVGAAYLPLDHSFPQQRIEHILREARPALVIYDEATKCYPSTKNLSYNELSKLETEPIKHPSPANDLAIVMYTSGSTGVPKGVRLPHRAILNRLQWQLRAFPFTATESVCVFKTALTFVDSVAEIWAPLTSTLALLIVPKHLTKDPQQLIAILDKHAIERLTLVPSLLRSLLMYLSMETNPNRLAMLKLWICSGETLQASLVDEYFRHFSSGEHKLCNFYGSTEIMADVTFHVMSAKSKEAAAVPIGLPVDNTIVYLLDESLRPVLAGEVGEVYVSGLNLAAGYVNNRDKERFVRNELAIDPIYAKLYKTGDFGRMGPTSNVIYYEGRTDSQVKIRGHRVDLSEVEKIVGGVEGVEKAVVLCYQAGEIGQALLAFVKSGSRMNEHQIEEILGEQLTSYMVPQVVLVENIPLLVNGKIDRRALLKSYENTNNNEDDTSYEIDIDYTGVPAAKHKDAEVLFKTVASVLNKSARSAISLSANFFEIGGNSLNSIYTITQLNNQGYLLNISDFLMAKNLGDVLHHMTNATGRNADDKPRFIAEKLAGKHLQQVKDIIAESFYKKADLEYYVIDDITREDYYAIVEQWWAHMYNLGMSFVVKDATSGDIIATTLNANLNEEGALVIRPESSMNVIMDFLEYVETMAIRDSPLIKGKILHCNMMATHSRLSAKENVAVIKFMEDKTLELAAKRQYSGILTTNTSPLTQQLATEVFNYTTLLNYQINQYVTHDNKRPFAAATDSVRVLVQFKAI